MTPARRSSPRPSITVAWQARPRLLSDRAVRAAVAAALAHGGRPDLAVGVVLVDDATLSAIHARFLGDPSPTDVIAFDLADEHGGLAGEIYASVDCASRVASERGIPSASELALYLVHGALHLCGFDDRTPAQTRRMRAAEASVMEGLRSLRERGLRR